MQLNPTATTCDSKRAPHKHEWARLCNESRGINSEIPPRLGAPHGNGHGFDPAGCIKHERLLECSLLAPRWLPALCFLKVGTVTGCHDLHFPRGIGPVHFHSQSYAARVQKPSPCHTLGGQARRNKSYQITWHSSIHVPQRQDYYRCRQCGCRLNT